MLLTRDGSGFLQVVGHVGDTTHELAMISGVLGACRNEVRDCAAAGEHRIGHRRIAPVNDNGGAQIGIGALILIVRDAVIVGVWRERNVQASGPVGIRHTNSVRVGNEKSPRAAHVLAVPETGHLAVRGIVGNVGM
jgi:hypothetical protein